MVLFMASFGSGIPKYTPNDSDSASTASMEPSDSDSEVQQVIAKEPEARDKVKAVKQQKDAAWTHLRHLFRWQPFWNV